MKRISVSTRAWVVVLCAILLQPWGAYRLAAADITPGYTFSSGEQNVTHTKLNNAAAGTINTTFYSGKSSAGSDPNTAFEFLLRDTSLDTFKRTTLQVAIFDHAALLSSRTAKTVPVLADGVFLMDSAAGNAYKQMTVTNLLFAGASVTAPTNESRFPALLGGALGSITLSNLLGGLTSHSLPTNGDVIPVLTANGGRAVKTMALSSIWSGMTEDTAYSPTNAILTFGANGLRRTYPTNQVFALPVAAPTTNDIVEFLQAGSLFKTNLAYLALLLGKQNIVQSRYTGTTNFSGLTSGAWSNVTIIGTSSLSNAITPRATTSKILVRVVLTASSAGGSDNGYMRVLRGGTAIGVGDDDTANRVEAGTSIPNLSDGAPVVWEWLDSPASVAEQTYWVQVAGVSGNTIYINRDSSDANTTSNGRYVSTLTLTEILQ